MLLANFIRSIFPQLIITLGKSLDPVNFTPGFNALSLYALPIHALPIYALPIYTLLIFAQSICTPTNYDLSI
jgi:hypothetical protein